MSSDQEQPKGILRINATFGFGRRHLAPLISEFAHRYTELEVVLELSDRPLDLTEHAMDVGIRFGLPPDARVIARPIAANRRLLCAAPAYLSRYGCPQRPSDLNAHRCIVIRENTATFNNWALHNGEQHVMVKVSGPLSTNHGEIAVDWALAGHGILLRSEWDVSGHLRRGELCQILPEWTGNQADIHAIYLPRHYMPSKISTFIAFLEQHFADFRAMSVDRAREAW